MPYIKGRNSSVSIKRETTRGVKETTGFTNGLPWEEFGLYESIGSTFKDESATGTTSVLQGEEITGWIADGSIKGKLDADYALWAFAGAFGVATPTTALGATTWAFSMLNNNLLPTHTVNYSRGDDGFRAVTGATIDKLTIDVGKDDATYAVDLKAIKEESGTTVTPVIAKPSKYILPFNWLVGFATTKAGLSAATTLAKVQSLNFELSNSVGGEEQFLGNQYRDDTPANGRSVMLKMSITLDTTNGLQTQFLAGTKLAFKLSGVANNLPVIGTSALKPSIIIETAVGLIKKTHKVERDSYIMYDLEVEIQECHLTTATIINAIPTLQ